MDNQLNQIDVQPSSAEPESTPAEVCSLLALPDLIHSKVLDYLPLKDILNFRLVCHSTFECVFQYSTPQLRQRLKNRVIQLMSPTDLHCFVTSVSTLPFTNFYIKYNQKLLSSDAMKIFMKNFGPTLEQFKTVTMYLCVTKEEYDFYCSMTSLKSLFFAELKPHMDPCHVSPFDCALCAQITEEKVKRARIPPNWSQTLESFGFHTPFETMYPYDVIDLCPQLTNILAGGALFPMFWESSARNDNNEVEALQRLTGFLNKTKLTSNPKPIQLACMSFTSNNPEDLLKRNQVAVIDFLSAVGSPHVKVTETHGPFLDFVYQNRHLLPKDTVTNILSGVKILVGICPAIQLCEMPHLEELKFDILPSTAILNETVIRNWASVPSCQPQWKNLRRIKGRMYYLDQIDDIKAMMNFLLGGPHSRPSLTQLSFKFRSPMSFPPSHFTSNFPNLQKLKLSRWSRNKADYSRLFVLLGQETKLKCLNLETSITLDDQTFIGPPHDCNPPLFARLTNLEVFQWYSVSEGYPTNRRFTDKLLVDVIRFMPLTHLDIYCIPLPKVTPGGIRALKEGPIIHTLKKFEFAFVETQLTSSKILQVAIDEVQSVIRANS